MWQVHEVKVITLTRGDLTSGLHQNLKPTVTTNEEKSAEIHTLAVRMRREKKTAKGRTELFINGVTPESETRSKIEW
jgi:hypothetical protein